MKNKILLFSLSALILASCSTAYKSGQTPDDLYYAKGKKVAEEDSKPTVAVDHTTYEDRVIRMSAYDSRWRSLDDDYDYNYNYSPYQYGYTYGYYYNPYYCTFPVYSHGTTFYNPKNTTIRMVNLNAYNNTMVNAVQVKSYNNNRTTVVRGYNNSNTYTPRSSNADTRTYTPSNSSSSSSNSNNSSSSSSSSGSNTSSGTSVSRPARGN